MHGEHTQLVRLLELIGSWLYQCGGLQWCCSSTAYSNVTPSLANDDDDDKTGYTSRQAAKVEKKRSPKPIHLWHRQTNVYSRLWSSSHMYFSTNFFLLLLFFVVPRRVFVWLCAVKNLPYPGVNVREMKNTRKNKILCWPFSCCVKMKEWAIGVCGIIRLSMDIRTSYSSSSERMRHTRTAYVSYSVL